MSMLFSSFSLFLYSELTQRAPLDIVHALLIMSLILLPSTVCIGMLFPSFFPLLKSEKGEIAMQVFGLSLGNILGLVISGLSYFIFPLPFISLGILLIVMFAVAWSCIEKNQFFFY
jgi:hypothetical protein